MHKIDLLKGQGIPAKTTLGSVVFSALIFVVPLLVAAGMGGLYFINRINIEIKADELARLNEAIAQSEPNIAMTRVLEKERDFYAERLNEVSKCVDSYLQWTPVLITLVDNMPSNMVMDQLSTTSGQDSRTGGRRNNDPNKPLTIVIPQRKMAMGLSGSGTDTFNTIVRQYQETLKESESLKPKLDDLTFSMKGGTAENPVEAFTMNFVFKNTK